ncbi:STE/STE11 protein kinase, variant 2 [Coprinopsis cinerea AmutBmut pab1-1]|nr:STE/STE11 protein kinase, variant 2 [Coprinopsis cinerea AmutBmut pab1-1]
MEAKTTTLPRPMGPRGPTPGRRPPFPTIRTTGNLPTSPIQPADPPMLAPPTLGIPQRGKKPILGLKIDKNNTSFELYAGGPSGPPESYMSPGDDARTIRPGPATIQPGGDTGTTTVPASKPGASEPITRIQDLLRDLNLTQPPPTVNPSPGDSILSKIEDPSSTQWSDECFEEISRLGEGAGGAVHKVKDKRNGMIMARKTITTREAPMKQLLRELTIMSSTKHVNIITFYGAYMSPSSSEIKIIMEYCEGGSLESVGKRIRERGAIVGEKIAGRLAEGVLQGLSYLHSKKTIHRDIKPSNILLSKEGVVKLCDFGVSGELILSQAGTFTGTSFYMAPERIQGKEYTIRSDVWSTGISLLELVQNRFPFPPDLPPIELMMYITNSEPPRLEDEPGVNWSEEMKDFIKQA